MELDNIPDAHTADRCARRPYMRQIRRGALAAGLLVMTGLGLSGTLAASNADEGKACRLSTLKGRYLYTFSATLLPPAFGVTGPTASNAAGVQVFNGDGTGTDTVTFNLGGAIVLENMPNQFTYTLNADCTGTYTVANGPSFDIFVAPDGEQYASIATAPPGNTGAAIIARVSRN
jgi:hypothetical protein